MKQISYWLVVQQGPELDKKYDLAVEELIIGRDLTAEIMIDSPAVSRRHAKIWLEENRVYIADLNSSNGTFINGTRLLGQANLNLGDEVNLGKSVVLVLGGSGNSSRPSTATMIETQVSEAPASARKTIIGEPVKRPTSPPQFEVKIAGEKPEVYTLTGERYSIGRQIDNDIVVNSSIVSRQHAILHKSPGGYSLESLPDITNPVFHENRPLTGLTRMQHNEQFRIGGRDPGEMVTFRYLDADSDQAHSPQVIDFLAKERITIGRDPGNDVVVASPQISRFHAQVERVGQRYRLTDLRSTNGTFVNGKRIEGITWLQQQDEIRVGANRFVVGDAGLSRIDETGGLQVEAIGLNKWVRKDLNLLKDISLVFNPREFIVVVGQSGGGKSTLIDAIAGYRPATDGKVYVNGIDVYRNFDAIRNEIGFVPQRDIIHMELTVYQALNYAALLRMPSDTTPDERRQRITQVLDDLDLTHRKDTQISSLSGGQQKRVSIGVELLTQPGLFFLDEPTSGLDPGTETALMHLMRRLADQGRTILLITHATKNVMLADKVIFLARGGYLTWFGPPDEALAYFDQFRSERDRRSHPIEFDEIYAILDDPANGSPEEWGQRYQAHEAHQKYIVQPVQSLGHALPAETGAKQRAVKSTSEKSSRKILRKASGFRQLLILSARNVRILTRDKPSLVLMLAVAPILSMLDVILSFVLGRDLFSYENGDFPNVVTSLFMPIMYSIMVGALAQMREFVKEADIYRRERLVNLKVLPYVFSKFWVAAIIGLYQALVYTTVHYLAFKMPGGISEFLAIYFSLYLATFAGMMIGLACSALAPNANAVPLIVIMLLVPQFVLGGAMIPVPDFISGPTSARWAFEAELAITGSGSDIAADECWALPESERNELTLEDKEARGCNCMGINALRSSMCNVPGIGKSYDPIIDEPEPAAPEDIGPPPAEPVLPPKPEQPAQNASQEEMNAYLQALSEYQETADQIQSDYQVQMQDYQSRSDRYREESILYQEAVTDWNVKRNAAVGEAEGLMKLANDNFGWTFVDKNDTSAYWKKVIGTWTSQGIIILTLLVISIVLIWRKDFVK